MTDELKLDRYREKLRRSLGDRFLLRTHVSLILVFCILVGWLTDLALLYNGLLTMSIRYPLAILTAYLGFLAGVYFWLEYSGIKEYLNWRKAQELVGENVQVGGPWNFKRTSASSFDSVSYVDGEGCFVVLLAAVILAVLFFFFGGYILMNAGALFAEIVLEVLLAAGLLKGIRTVEASGWVIGVWRATRWSLAFTMFIALIFGWWAQASYPSAHTLPQVIDALTR